MVLQNYPEVLNWWLLHKWSNEPCKALLWHSWYIKVTFITTKNTYWIQQFVLAASEKGHSFMVHNGQKNKMISWSKRQHRLDNDSADHILYIELLLHSIFHIRPSCMFWRWKRCGGKLNSFSQTYQQIHWSDCQYRRPGSCNRHIRSQWISPFLKEEERESSSGYQGNMTNTS